jgi:hypothetical protein
MLYLAITITSIYISLIAISVDIITAAFWTNVKRMFIIVAGFNGFARAITKVGLKADR